MVRLSGKGMAFFLCIPLPCQVQSFIVLGASLKTLRSNQSSPQVQRIVSLCRYFEPPYQQRKDMK